ncbi:hypothetical protein C8Q75DRAFT_255377 [Abortiporus biennis]|nr:hypothetical protein C8Q75DRAFT_255377 [Abortiporus biennis]
MLYSVPIKLHFRTTFGFLVSFIESFAYSNLGTYSSVSDLGISKQCRQFLVNAVGFNSITILTASSSSYIRMPKYLYY